jgi:2-polyprenyl-3-methyl-5-hydroxy-6-metoxy-1,4-benzoquinol methylase
MSEFDAFAHSYEEQLDDSLKVSGETAAYFAQYKALYLSWILGSDFTGRILDYGCGIGSLTRLLKASFPKASLHGFDTSEKSLERARTLVPGVTFFSNPSGLQEKYHVIVVVNVLHHVDPSLRAEFLSKVSGYLSSGGRLVVIEHNPLNPMSRWVVRTCPFDKGVTMVKRRKLLSDLRKLNHTIDRSDYLVFFPRFLARLRPLEPRLNWLPLGAQYSVVARRTG